MKITGFKDIARYLTKITGATCSERTAQRYAKDGMPVRRIGRAVVADTTLLDQWATQRWPSAVAS